MRVILGGKCSIWWPSKMSPVDPRNVTSSTGVVLCSTE